MTFPTVSELSLLETLEQKLQSDVSVSLLAELERALLHLRSELSGPKWNTLCAEFYKRPLPRRLTAAADFRFTAEVIDSIMEDAFQARSCRLQSPAHIVSAWEYSLPISRSLRSRTINFAREISEIIRTTVEPRILVLGAGQMREASEALQNQHHQCARFVAIDSDAKRIIGLRNTYPLAQLEILQGDPAHFSLLSPQLGSFDLIYSATWLDSSPDSQAKEWLGLSIEMLRAGGRLLVANCTPGSRDSGWIEACWNWHPHYRSEEHLAQLVMDLKHPSIRGHAVFSDESGASAYLEIHSL